MSLKRKICQKTPMKIADFMSFVNNHTKLGYYTTKDNIIGHKGDFVTSPEISQMFGECIGIYIANSFMNRIFKNVRFVELGPGKGTLASDIIRTLKQIGGFYKTKYKYVSIDKNPYFRQTQNRIISKHVDFFESYCETDEVQSSDNESDTLNIFLAHEFFDALPANLYYREKSNFFEIMVDKDDVQGLILKKFPIYNVDNSLCDYIRFNSTDCDYMEYSDDVRKYVLWIKSRISECTGPSVGLIIDYGYEKPSPFSLRAILKHQFVPLFDHIGESDYSVNVDFNLIRSIFESGKRQNCSLSTQARFLIDNGIFERMEMLGHVNTHLLGCLRQDVHRLISSTQMGQIYKVLTFKNNND